MQNNAQFAIDDLSGSVAPDAAGTQVPAVHDRHASLKVVYIAGDGRSGSTLLDRLIGAYPGVLSCGELGNLLTSTGSMDEYCACGARARECLFWREVMRQWSSLVPGFSRQEYQALQQRYERLRSLLRPFSGLSFGSPRFARYAEYTRALFGAIAENSGARVIVDSSKNPARALALSRIPGLELRMLHLVRDVRGVAYSLRIPYLERPKEGPFAHVKRRSNLRFAGTWALVNYCCERVRAQLRSPSLFVRYEDYTADPDQVLGGVAELLELPPMPYAAGVGHLLQQGHQIAGNELRMRPVQTIRTDEAWRSQLGQLKQKGLYLLVLPLVLRYRYRL
jgi:hypothetical protein